MNRTYLALPVLMALLLAACGGGDDTVAVVVPPTVSVPTLALGSYAVTLGDENQPSTGEYYSAADGSHLLIVNNDNEQAQTLYKQESGGKWASVPAAKANVTITLLQSDVVMTPSTDAAQLAGSYVAQTPAGLNAAFTLAADGTLAAVAGSACQVSGKATAGKLPGTLQASLSFTGCADLPATAAGILVADTAYAPARFRLIADDGKQVVDLWAYAE